VVVKQSSSGPTFNSINAQLYRTRQEGNESIDKFGKRLKDGIEAFELISGILDLKQQAQLFINGLHPRHSRVRQILTENSHRAYMKTVDQLITKALELEESIRINKPKSINFQAQIRQKKIIAVKQTDENNSNDNDNTNDNNNDGNNNKSGKKKQKVV